MHVMKNSAAHITLGLIALYILYSKSFSEDSCAAVVPVPSASSTLTAGFAAAPRPDRLTAAQNLKKNVKEFSFSTFM